MLQNSEKIHHIAVLEIKKDLSWEVSYFINILFLYL